MKWVYVNDDTKKYSILSQQYIFGWMTFANRLATIYESKKFLAEWALASKNVACLLMFSMNHYSYEKDFYFQADFVGRPLGIALGVKPPKKCSPAFSLSPVVPI